MLWKCLTRGFPLIRSLSAVFFQFFSSNENSSRSIKRSCDKWLVSEVIFTLLMELRYRYGMPSDSRNFVSNHSSQISYCKGIWFLYCFPSYRKEESTVVKKRTWLYICVCFTSSSHLRVIFCDLDHYKAIISLICF